MDKTLSEYMKTLSTPLPEAPKNGRKMYGFSVDTFWVPFLKAQSIIGNIDIAPAVLGAPTIPTTVKKTGEVKVSAAGKIMEQTQPEIRTQVNTTMQAFGSQLMAVTGQVRKANTEDWNKLDEQCRKEGDALLNSYRPKIQDALDKHAHRLHVLELAEAIAKKEEQTEQQEQEQEQAAA